MHFESPKIIKMHLQLGRHPGLCRTLAKSFERKGKSGKKKREKERKRKKKRKRRKERKGVGVTLGGCFLALIWNGCL